MPRRSKGYVQMQTAETSLWLLKQEDYFFSKNQTGMDVGALLRKIDPVCAHPSWGQPSPSCLFSPSEACGHCGRSRRKSDSQPWLAQPCLWPTVSCSGTSRILIFYCSYTFCESYLLIIFLSRVSVTILSHQMKPREENTYAGLSWDLKEVITLLALSLFWISSC